MELDIEKAHNILIEAGLPSSINDLKNPTEQFVINLINTFLWKFNIDVSVIEKPTLDEQSLMSYCDDPDLIGLINLYVAMAQICNRIFLNDLCITDITSPGSKRVRKQAKFLANFILYANAKQSEIQDRVDEIQNRGKLLQEINDKRNEIQEAINDKALNVSKQLSLKEKYLDEISKIQARMESNNKVYIELTSKLNAAEERKQEAQQLSETYRTQVLKLNKDITKLQSEIVQSPEVYETNLRELEEQRKLKIQEREIMQEAFRDKKHLIEQKESVQNFIQKQLDKIPEIQNIYGQLKKVNIQADNIRKQVEASRENVSELEKQLAVKKDECQEKEVNDLHHQYEERLSPLHKLQMQLQRSKKLTIENAEAEKIRYNEAWAAKNKMQNTSSELEDETTLLMKNFQELYNNEIMTETEVWKSWTGD